MAPNKKKKKPASNPARGFATVSTPSKPKSITVTPAEPQEQTATLNSNDLRNGGNQNAQKALPSQKVADPSDTHNLSPEELEHHLQEAELQRLVERGSKSKKDAIRQETRLMTERRVLRSQASFLPVSVWLPADLVEEIFNAALRADRNMESGSKREIDAVSKPALSEEDVILRLWTLQQTLLKLGFKELKVDEALKYVYSNFSTDSPSAGPKDSFWRLEEAIEWLAMHCETSELPAYEQDLKAQIPVRETEDPFVEVGKS